MFYAKNDVFWNKFNKHSLSLIIISTKNITIYFLRSFSMAGVSDVMKKIKSNNVKFVDFRFTDTKGKEQHVTVPVSAFDKSKFTEGHAFDGSSIAGWKGINASDMLLIPDPNTANMDPFMEEPTMILT